ncbi:MAG: sodium-extruding oxaloacetate decarboxylase subunit alpha [Candidatus Eisenbacteria bacterium]
MTPKQTAKVQITDTILRDAHQSLLATRMPTKAMLPVAHKLDSVGYFSLEMWGGATFDSCIRFLREDPWERVRTLRRAIPNTRMQMLLRAQNIVGYRHYADDIVERFVELAADAGIDVFRIFDALNDIRNLQTAMRATKKAGKHAEGCISYTTSPVHTLDFYIEMSMQLEEMGADTLCIKDMAGLLTQHASTQLVSALKKKISIPIHLHCHATTGQSEMSYLKGIEAGASIIDTALSPLALGTSQPATESLVAALAGGPYDTGLDLGLLIEIAEHFKGVRKDLAEHESGLAGVDTRILSAQVPGGMLSNLASQLRKQNAMDRYDEVLQEVVRVRADMGYPPLVTPSSQVVGTQAVINVLQGERYKVLTEHTKNYLLGKYGKAPGEIKKELVDRVIAETGEQPITQRPADLIEPELEKDRKELVEKLGRRPRAGDEDVITYALFPEVGLEFLNIRDGFKQPEPATPASKPEKAATTAPAPEPTPTPAAVPHSAFKVTVNGRSYDVSVEDLAGGGCAQVTSVRPSVPRAEAGPAAPPPTRGKTVKAPLTGDVLRLLVGEGDTVKNGDEILVLEAMKMETKVVSPFDGRIGRFLVGPGNKVENGDPLVVIE